MKKECIYKGAGVWKRIGAFLVDYFLISLFAGIIYGVVMTATIGEAALKRMSSIQSMEGLYTCMAVIMLFYCSLQEQGKRNATWGKRLTGICVARTDGNAVTKIDIWFRNCIKTLPLLIAAFTMTAGIGEVVLAGWWILLLIGLCLKEHRSIHDRMAGTIIVNAVDVKVQTENAENSSVDRTIPELQPLQGANAEVKENKTVPGRRQLNKWYLIGISGQYTGMELELSEELILGRESASCNFIFDAETAGISRRHCKIFVQDESVWVQDLGSSFGTFDKWGKRLTANTKIRLESGDMFLLGANERFQVVNK